MEELKPLQHAQEIFASGNSFMQNFEPLKSVLDKIPLSEDALNGLEKTISDLANVSAPL